MAQLHSSFVPGPWLPWGQWEGSLEKGKPVTQADPVVVVVRTRPVAPAVEEGAGFGYGIQGEASRVFQGTGDKKKALDRGLSHTYGTTKDWGKESGRKSNSVSGCCSPMELSDKPMPT